jgi:phytoene synthase
MKFPRVVCEIAMNYPKEFPPALAPDFEAARRLHRKHGTSYYFASQLFPLEKRLATYALYGFFRVPDEIVDAGEPQTADEALEVRHKLDFFQRRWEKAYAQGDSDDPILRVASWIFHHYAIPFDYSIHFLGAMQTDLEKARYENYVALEEYMYGSAAVVGLMMTHVVGYESETTLHYATQLGYAMQLTNFLRDIDEDYTLRGRVYMPQDELHRFGLSDEDIEARCFSPEFAEFVQFQAQRAHALYDEAGKGISHLAPDGRLAVRVASALYRSILDRLQEREWNVFAGRARTSLPQKIALAAGAYKENRG